MQMQLQMLIAALVKDTITTRHRRGSRRRWRGRWRDGGREDTWRRRRRRHPEGKRKDSSSDIWWKLEEEKTLCPRRARVFKPNQTQLDLACLGSFICKSRGGHKWNANTQKCKESIELQILLGHSYVSAVSLSPSPSACLLSGPATSLTKLRLNNSLVRYFSVCWVSPPGAKVCPAPLLQLPLLLPCVTLSTKRGQSFGGGRERRAAAAARCACYASRNSESVFGAWWQAACSISITHTEEWGGSWAT